MSWSVARAGNRVGLCGGRTGKSAIRSSLNKLTTELLELTKVGHFALRLLYSGGRWQRLGDGIDSVAKQRFLGWVGWLMSAATRFTTSGRKYLAYHIRMAYCRKKEAMPTLIFFIAHPS